MIEDLLIWKRSYEIGIPEVDYQHHYFLEMVNTLNRRIDEGMDRNAIAAHLKEIIYNTNFHFLSESNLMKYKGYDGVRDHLKLHEEISTELMLRFTLFEQNQLDFDEFLKFLVHWFIDHTVNEDTKFGHFIKDRRNRTAGE